MKTILTAALAVSMIASAGAASAQPSSYRGDGRSAQTQRQDDRRAPAPVVRNDNRGQAASNDRYDARDRYDDNRGGYNQQPQRRYNAGRYQRPAGYQARHWTQGQRLPQAYRGRAYVVDYNRYGLRAPPRGYQYTRVDNDVVLTAVATGLIASVIVGLFQ